MRPAERKRTRIEDGFILLGLALSALGIGVGVAQWMERAEADQRQFDALLAARKCRVVYLSTETMYQCDLPVSGAYLRVEALRTEALARSSR